MLGAHRNAQMGSLPPRRAVRSSVSSLLLHQDSTLPTADTAVPSEGPGAKATRLHGAHWAERKPGSPKPSPSKEHPRPLAGLQSRVEPQQCSRHAGKVGPLRCSHPTILSTSLSDHTHTQVPGAREGSWRQGEAPSPSCYRQCWTRLSGSFLPFPLGGVD